MSQVIVVRYQNRWKEDYESIRQHILPAVANIAITIEHVGSISVPGLAAKPLIDIDIIVPDLEASAKASAALISLGYTAIGNLGLPGREAFAHAPELISHNLYVVIEGCEPLVNHLLVRDALRQNPQLVEEYSRLKLALAKQFPDDIGSYIDGKTDFLLGVLSRGGFPAEALRRAEIINRKTD